MAKKTTFQKFDVAELLDSPEMVAEFLSAAIDEYDGDMATITSALNTVARARNMSQLARDTGVTREGLYKALSPDGNPSVSTFLRLLHAMGLNVAITVAAK